MRPEIIPAALAAALPTMTGLVGIVLSRNDLGRFDSRLSVTEGWLYSRLSGIKTRQGSRITAVDNRRHADMVQVIGRLTGFEVRAARLEEKQSR